MLKRLPLYWCPCFSRCFVEFIFFFIYIKLKRKHNNRNETQNLWFADGTHWDFVARSKNRNTKQNKYPQNYLMLCCCWLKTKNKQTVPHTYGETFIDFFFTRSLQSNDDKNIYKNECILCRNIPMSIDGRSYCRLTSNSDGQWISRIHDE